MKDLLNKGFQSVSETEMVMIEGGNLTPPGVEPGPAPDDAGQYPNQPEKKDPVDPGIGGGGGKSHSNQ